MSCLSGKELAYLSSTSRPIRKMIQLAAPVWKANFYIVSDRNQEDEKIKNNTPFEKFSNTLSILNQLTSILEDWGRKTLSACSSFSSSIEEEIWGKIDALSKKNPPLERFLRKHSIDKNFLSNNREKLLQETRDLNSRVKVFLKYCDWKDLSGGYPSDEKLLILMKETTFKKKIIFDDCFLRLTQKFLKTAKTNKLKFALTLQSNDIIPGFSTDRDENPFIFCDFLQELHIKGSPAVFSFLKFFHSSKKFKELKLLTINITEDILSYLFFYKEEKEIEKCKRGLFSLLSENSALETLKIKEVAKNTNYYKDYDCFKYIFDLSTNYSFYSSLKYLKLEGNFLGRIPEHLFGLGKMLSQLIHLKTFKLSSCPYLIKKPSDFNYILPCSSHLETLIWENVIEDIPGEEKEIGSEIFEKSHIPFYPKLQVFVFRILGNERLGKIIQQQFEDLFPSLRSSFFSSNDYSTSHLQRKNERTNNKGLFSELTLKEQVAKRIRRG